MLFFSFLCVCRGVGMGYIGRSSGAPKQSMSLVMIFVVPLATVATWPLFLRVRHSLTRPVEVHFWTIGFKISYFAILEGDNV